MKELNQVFANKGIEVKYRKKLENLVDAMNKSVLFWLLADYGNRSVEEISNQIQKRIKQWKRIFGDKSKDIAVWFVKSVKKQSETGLKQAFAQQGIHKHIELPKSIYKDVKLNNEVLIKSIPEKYFSGIETAAIMATMYGWSKDVLRNNIERRYESTEKRVAIISKDQNHKTSELFKTAICKRLGIRYAAWVYTWRSETPRQNHIMLDGKVFDIDKGCYDETTGKYVYPSMEYGCKCTFKPIILDDTDDEEEIRQAVENNSYYLSEARSRH